MIMLCPHRRPPMHICTMEKRKLDPHIAPGRKVYRPMLMQPTPNVIRPVWLSMLIRMSDLSGHWLFAKYRSFTKSTGRLFVLSHHFPFTEPP